MSKMLEIDPRSRMEKELINRSYVTVLFKCDLLILSRADF